MAGGPYATGLRLARSLRRCNASVQEPGFPAVAPRSRSRCTSVATVSSDDRRLTLEDAAIDRRVDVAAAQDDADLLASHLLTLL